LSFEGLQLTEHALDVWFLLVGQPTVLVEVREHPEIAQQGLGLRLRRAPLAREALVELAAEVVGTLLQVIEESHATTVPPPDANVAGRGRDLRR
jgi:hypothetical protein